jgi:hypothetical protein
VKHIKGEVILIALFAFYLLALSMLTSCSTERTYRMVPVVDAQTPWGVRCAYNCGYDNLECVRRCPGVYVQEVCR